MHKITFLSRITWTAKFSLWFFFFHFFPRICWDLPERHTKWPSTFLQWNFFIFIFFYFIFFYAAELNFYRFWKNCCLLFLVLEVKSIAGEVFGWGFSFWRIIFIEFFWINLFYFYKFDIFWEFSLNFCWFFVVFIIFG